MNQDQILHKIVLQSDECCLGCKGHDLFIFSAQDLLNNLPGDYCIVKCSVCGLMRTNPRPTTETIGIYYPEDYGPYLGSVVRSAHQPQSALKNVIKKCAKAIFRFNDMRLPSVQVGKLLEVGCASGSYLHQMAEKGWNVHGIEFSVKAAMTAKELGYPVYAGSLETAFLPEESYDLIVGWMVLEHLHDPVGALKKLKEWSNASTWLVLSVPNAGSYEFKLFNRRWFALQVPTHMYHFTPNTLNKVLEAGGWKLEKIFYQRTLTNFIGSLGYLLRDKGFNNVGEKFINYPSQGKRWINYLLFPISWLISLFRHSGNLTIWAKPI